MQLKILVNDNLPNRLKFPYRTCFYKSRRSPGINELEAPMNIIEAHTDQIIGLSMEPYSPKREVKKTLNLKEVFEELNFIEPIKFT